MLSKNKAKYIRSLHLKKNREKEGVFIAEGKKIAAELLRSAVQVTELFASNDFILENQGLIRAKQINATAVTDQELAQISALKEPDDALLICAAAARKKNIVPPANHLSLYLDGIRDPGNFGTIIRVCDWFGIENIFCSEDCTELYNPKTIQSSMGSFIRVNVSYVNIQELMESVSDQNVNITVYGAALEGENVFSIGKFEPGLLVIGNEANGIRPQTQKFIVRQISIPSHKKSGAESLNAAIATSVLLAEYRRLNP